MGGMAIFGSYIEKDRALMGEAVHVIVLDTFVAVLAGIIMFPACFSYGLEVTAGPSLLFDTMASHPKIAKQFHLPFQSGNDRILKEMNRHYDRARYLSLIEYGRKKMPELVFTSDVIVGFPGETEEEFEDTVSLIEQVRFDALFTFIYSPRPGTPAAKMPDPTPREEKNRRFDRLLAVQNQISEEKHRAYVGKTLRVLVDGRDGDQLTARTDGGRLVRFEGSDDLIGQFLNVTITDSTTWSLLGTVAP